MALSMYQYAVDKTDLRQIEQSKNANNASELFM